MAAAVPGWKQALLSKRSASKEEVQPSEDKYAGLPAWKRDLLMKKEEDMRRAQELEKEKPKIIFGRAPSGSSSTDASSARGPAAIAAATAAALQRGASESAKKLYWPPRNEGGAAASPRAAAPVSPASPAVAVPSGSVRARAASFSDSNGTSPTKPVRPPADAAGAKSSGSPAPESPAASGVQAIIQKLKLAPETRAEQVLKEKSSRRRGSDHGVEPLTPVRAAASAPVSRATSATLLTPSSGRPSPGILQSSSRKKPALTRRISWSDNIGSAPLVQFGPSAYYSESEDDEPAPAPSGSKEDDEEITGLALRVHKSVTDRYGKAHKSPSQEAARRHSTDDDEPGPIVLDESDATMVW